MRTKTHASWTVDDAREDPFRKGIYIRDAKGGDVARVYRTDAARLIASAPELLEACEEALRLPTLVTFSETSSSAHSHGERRAEEYARKVDVVLEKIRATILKATGEGT